LGFEIYFFVNYQKYILRKRLSILVINKSKKGLLISPDAREKPCLFLASFGKAAGKRMVDKAQTIRS